MSAASPPAAKGAAASSNGDGHGSPADAAAAGGKGKSKKLVLIAVPAVLVLVVAGLWFSGILPGLLGMGAPADPAQAEATKAPDAHGAAKPDAHAAAKPDAHGAKPDAHGAKPTADAHGAKPAPPAAAAPASLTKGGPNFMELPEVIANLNVGARRASYVKLRPRIEMARPEDEAAIRNAIPRLQDLFQTYLREMRPEELRGSAGTYRLREELIARANIALAPVRIVDVLLPEMLIQ